MRAIAGLLVLAVGAVLATGTEVARPAPTKRNVVCYYDSKSFIREGLGKLVVDDMEAALQFCNYLIYGYAGIERDTSKAISTNEQLDLDLGKGLYRTVTRLKRKYPDVRVLLSVGGDQDVEGGDNANDVPNKYLQLLETAAGRRTFIDTAYALVKSYGFDGIDVAWQFPKIKPKKQRGVLGSFFKGIKKTFGGQSVVDKDAAEHKEQFTALLRDLKTAFRPDGLLVSTTVLPNVNSSLYFDVDALSNYVDFVNLAAFDFYTPDRNPTLADHPAQLHGRDATNAGDNVDYVVRYWLSGIFPASKINLGIASYGRVWKMSSDSGPAGEPPVHKTTNEAPLGPQTRTQGLYSWPEVCTLLSNEDGVDASKASAMTSRRVDGGVYAFRAANNDGEDGLWMSYEDTNSAVEKASYAVRKKLGGVALFDLAYDDFRDRCHNGIYPILRAIKHYLVAN